MTLVGIPTDNNSWNFSASQWKGLVLAGLVGSSLSLAANIGVIVLHSLLTFVRPYIVNRVSLRMILLSCVFNLLYSISQLVSDRITNQSTSCRAFAYVLIASDTMSCMCLAMVGLNLVMIFVFKIPRTIKTELVYYFIIAASGILVTVIPLYVGTPKGPKDTSQITSCWYHYYFDGRMTNIFNWMYYYAWIMFSIVIAALFAAISIRFISKKQRNFGSALNIFKDNRKHGSSVVLIRKYTKDTDIFLKIARRCILYSLIPLLCKSWGVGIEIAASLSAYIPYVVFLLDRLFTCILGFMIGCLYFTDPAILASLKYYSDLLKKRYVHDYFSIQYQAAHHSTKATYYPHTIKITPVRNSMTFPPTMTKAVQYREHAIDKVTSQFSIDSDVLQDTDNRPAVKIATQGNNQLKYSILEITTSDGTTYLPNEQQLGTGSVFMIPMRRINHPGPLHNETSHHQTMRNSYMNTDTDASIDILVLYKFALGAKFMHWILTTLFRVKCVQQQEEEKPRRRTLNKLFDNFTTENAEPSSFIDTSNNPMEAIYELDERGSQKLVFDHEALLSEIRSSPVSHQYRRKTSISVGALGRERAQEKLHSPIQSSSGGHPMQEKQNRLKKILDRGRAMSVSWNKRSLATKGNINSSSSSSHSPKISKASSHEDTHLSLEQDDPEPLEYPNELAPRPQTPYIKSHGKQDDEDKIRQATSELDKKEDKHSMNTSYHYSGASPRFVDRANDSRRSSAPNTDLDSSSAALEILKHGRTVVINISNWSNNDENRFTTISEPWDIKEQIREIINM